MDTRMAAEMNRQWLITWNPKKWQWKDFDKSQAATMRGKSVVHDWTCQSKEPKLGDRVYLEVVGTGKKKGIVASGVVVTEPYQEKALKDKNARKIGVSFDVILPLDKVLPQELLKTYFPETNWSSPFSGIEIKPPSRKISLETMWQKYVDSIKRGSNANEVDHPVDARSYFGLAKTCYDKKQYSECLKYLRFAMKEGNVDAKRFYSRLLDLDGVFRETVEHDYNMTTARGIDITDQTQSPDRNNQSSSFPQDAEAQFDLGNQYYTGSGVRQDYSEAVRCYRLAAEQGHANAQYNLGVCLLDGTGVSRNVSEAVKWFRSAAEQEDADAQFWLGQCYLKGNGVSKSESQAFNWFRRAANHGQLDAQNQLGDCYYNGKGVPQDYTIAANWYRMAAEQGNASSQYGLGECYYYGHGVGTNRPEAVKWYRKAAKQGNTEAQYSLGFCYYSGEGIKTDYSEAVTMFRTAALKGYGPAQNKLGNCFYYGNGVEQNDTEAVKWYRMAAEQGITYAQLNLGDCYRIGRGVEKNQMEALKWYRKAAAQGDEDAKYWISQIQEQTPNDSTSGQQRTDIRLRPQNTNNSRGSKTTSRRQKPNASNSSSSPYQLRPYSSLSNESGANTFQLKENEETNNKAQKSSFFVCMKIGAILGAVIGLFGGCAEIVDGSSSASFWTFLGCIIAGAFHGSIYGAIVGFLLRLSRKHKKQ